MSLKKEEENKSSFLVFSAAAAKKGYPITCRMQAGYDHSYYFISTFMRDHIDHHARALGLRPNNI